MKHTWFGEDGDCPRWVRCLGLDNILRWRNVPVDKSNTWMYVLRQFISAKVKR